MLMQHEDLIALVEATDAFNNMAKQVIMSHRKALTKSQMDALVGLRFADKMSMTQLAEHLAVSKEQATRATAPLVDRGLVKRERSADNYRIVEVSLTGEGWRVLEEDLAAILSEMEEHIEPLSLHDRERLIEASRVVVEVLAKLRA